MKRFALEQQVCRTTGGGLMLPLLTEVQYKQAVAPSFTYTRVGTPPTRCSVRAAPCLPPAGWRSVVTRGHSGDVS